MYLFDIYSRHQLGLRGKEKAIEILTKLSYYTQNHETRPSNAPSSFKSAIAYDNNTCTQILNAINE
jgi:hypothetical protein